MSLPHCIAFCLKRLWKSSLSSSATCSIHSTSRGFRLTPFHNLSLNMVMSHDIKISNILASVLQLTLHVHQRLS